MIAHLSGVVIDKNLGTLIVDVNGVGYEVSVTPKLSSQFDTSSKISLIIFTDVKENAIVLYGFNTGIERQTFLLLKKVKGIGSRSAMSILSSIEPEKLMIAIGSGDTTALTKIQGIGKKSAERIIVELREQVVEIAKESRILADEIIISSTGSNNNLSSIEEDAVLALQKLGFPKDTADRAVKKAIFEKPDSLKDVGDLLKNSLAFLG
jgi:Holliday junction DNA helicase RuvA